MTEDEESPIARRQYDDITEDVRYIRQRMDDAAHELTGVRLLLENRITKLETSARIWGAVSGVLAAFGMSWYRGRN